MDSQLGHEGCHLLGTHLGLALVGVDVAKDAVTPVEHATRPLQGGDARLGP